MRCAAAALVFLVLALPARADNWPHWRGPTHDGISKETGLPTKWSATENVAWKLDLPGQGSSTPVVWGERIFLTSMDRGEIVVLCAGTDGKEKWKRKLATARGRTGSFGEGDHASPSPSTDGKHVYAFAGPGDLAAFDNDGKEVWRFNVQDRYGRFKIAFGMHTTPTLHGDRLYLQLIHSAGAWVVAIDKATGKDVWKVKRDSDGYAECEHSYASSCLWQKGKQAMLITHGNDYAIGHRLEDGKEVWRVGGLNPKDNYNRTLRFVASPVATPDLIVIPSAKNRGVVGLKPDASGLIMPGSKHEQWRKDSGTPDVPSPLVAGGLVYLCGEKGTLTCLDATTGKQLYSERVHNQIHRASPVYADGKVYCTARDGTVTVVKAGRKFEKLATNRMGERLYASPAIANGRIYLRTAQALYAIGK
jgi:outer membrane protein assembly factor BamB